MILDARAITEFQSCQRKPLFSHDYQVIRYRPKSLFDRCLRQSILSVSAGADPVSASKTARAAFMEAAAESGLETAYPPYTVAKDYCAMLDTIIRSLAKLTLLVVKKISPQPLNGLVDWRFSSVQDESGTLHRWITCDRWNEAALYREMHGWYTMGDIAVARQNLQLHVIEIGREIGGRRSSPWARAWKNASLPNTKIHFKRKDGKSFSGWKPVYIADDPYTDIDAWVERMWTEGAAQDCFHHVNINMPLESTCDETQRQILTEAIRIRQLIDERGSMGWRAQSMSRGACDGMVPCPWQEACFNEVPIEVDKLGLYQLKVPVQVRPARDRKQAIPSSQLSTVDV